MSPEKHPCSSSPLPVVVIMFGNVVVQSGASSQAKHGGAYFLAVGRGIKDPIAVLGWHEVPGV